MGVGDREADPQRRKLVNWFLETSAGALFMSVAYPVLRYISPPEMPEASTNQVEAGPANDPEFVSKGFKIVRFGMDPVIVIRVGDGEFRAYSATCTHLQCIVGYRKPQNIIWCNCHNGQFDPETGKNVGGPPPRPLVAYSVKHIVKSAGDPGTLVVSRV